MLWLKFFTFQGSQTTDSTTDRFVHFLRWPARFDLFRFRIPREIMSSHTSVGSRARGPEDLIAFNSSAEYEAELRSGTTWRIGSTTKRYPFET